MKRTWAAVPLLLVAMVAGAKPFVPPSDAAVLERGVPKRLQPPAGTKLDLATAVRLASHEVEQGRRLADPRHFGRAQALLSPWWNTQDPPTQVLLLRGTIRQSLHEFADARGDLQKVVTREPGNAQAWLLLATVEQVTGDLDSARTRCQRLEALVSPLIAAACHAGVEGAGGDARAAMTRLESAMQQSTRMPAELQAWARSVQGELALRLGDEALAMRCYALSLNVDPEDLYTRAAFADLLIDQGRNEEALKLVRGRTQADALLLRAAIATHAMRSAEAPAFAKQMAERIEASRRGGDRTHLREQARFTLVVLGDARGALALARENWTQQKEPADVRVALEAAIAASRLDEAREIATWARRSRLEDPRVVKLLARWDRA